MTGPVRVAILTVSDGCAAGTREDESGEVLVAWATERGYDIVERAVVADDIVPVTTRLIAWADHDLADVILTTGGTGFTERDVTPEATRVVIQREAPGIAEALRADAIPRLPHAMLSRGVAGIRERTLIVNFPGSPAGVRDGTRVLSDILEHAVALLRGTSTLH